MEFSRQEYLEWVAIPFSRAPPRPRDQTWVTHVAGRFFTIWATKTHAAAAASVVSDSVRPQRRQPTRLPHPWDSPGKNTGVGCHFLLQSMKVKSESEVAQSCPTLVTAWTVAHQAPLSMGFSRQKYWSGMPLPSPNQDPYRCFILLLYLICPNESRSPNNSS